MRFWPKVVKLHGKNACWEWNSTKNEHGYGVIGRGGKYGGMLLAHRVSWKMHSGPIPDNLCVLHRCDNPKCVNPDHLFLGSRADNNADMITKGRAKHDGFLGVSNPMVKLTDSDVLEIRKLYIPGVVTQRQIAKKYNVDNTLISLIIRRKAWRHI